MHFRIALVKDARGPDLWEARAGVSYWSPHFRGSSSIGS